MKMLFNREGLVENLSAEMDIEAYGLAIGGTIVEMQGPRPSPEHQALISGKWEIPQDFIISQKEFIESVWREAEYTRATKQLEMLEDEDPKAEPGTLKQWKNYRMALRNWTLEGNTHFPNSIDRPAAPE